MAQMKARAQCFCTCIEGAIATGNSRVDEFATPVCRYPPREAYRRLLYCWKPEASSVKLTMVLPECC